MFKNFRADTVRLLAAAFGVPIKIKERYWLPFDEVSCSAEGAAATNQLPLSEHYRLPS